MEKNEAGEVISIDKVADEINVGQDELAHWVRQQGQGLFRPTDTQVLAQFGPVSDWVMAQSYEPEAIHTFMQVADFYLIAHGEAVTWWQGGGVVGVVNQGEGSHGGGGGRSIGPVEV